MAKKGNKFELNKGGSTHDFKLDKGARRHFDLSKDKDDEVVASSTVTPQVDEEPLIDTENLNPTVDATGNGQEEPQKRSGKWIWILVILAILAILFLFLIPKNQKDGQEEEPVVVEQKEEAQQDAMEDREAAEAAISAQEQEADKTEETGTETENIVTPDNSTTPDSRGAENTMQPLEAPAPKADNRTANTGVPTAHSSARPSTPVGSTPYVSDDIETEARKVIRGHYGNNPERKQNLGEKYPQIQNRVNELMRGDN